MQVTTCSDAGVLTITFSRPEKRNALTNEMYVAAADALRAAEIDPSVLVVQLGGGTSFCAGNDVLDFMAHTSSQLPMQAPAFLAALHGMSKPVVACVRGNAIGIGLTMLAHCDYVVAADSARLQAPFTRLGLCPEAGASFLLPLTIGKLRATRWMLLGEVISAQDAFAAGLVSEVIDDAHAESRALEVCGALATLPSASVRATKRLINDAVAEAVRDAMAREGKVFSGLLTDGTAASALQAFGSRSKR
jgi:enoyl-CoA hydratase/carnithine racemase